MGSYLFKNCVCVLMLLSAFLVRGNQFELKFREISPPGGFTFGAINHVIEDRHGFIWFSSRHGLFRYNTETIEKFIHIPANPNSIPSNIINSMSKDIDGTLWFATEGGVCFYNEKIEVFETVLFVNEGIDTLKSAVQQIICDKDGRIWILSNSILYRSRYGSNITERITITSGNSLATFIYKDDDERIWLKSSSGIAYWSDYPYHLFQHFGQVLNNLIHSMLFTGKELWIGYGWNGADCYNINGELVAHYGENTTEEFNIRSNRVRTILKDSTGTIWMGTYNGIVLLHNHETQFINSRNTEGLSHSSIYDIYTDSKSGIWVSTWSGTLSYTNPNYNWFNHINKQNGLNNNVVSSFTQLENTIFIGTEGGGLNVYNLVTEEVRSVPYSQNISERHNIKALITDHSGNLWVGTFNNGLWRLQFKNNNLVGSDQVLNGSFYHLAVDNNTLWAGSFFQGLYQIDLTTLEMSNFKADSPSPISDNQVRTLLLDSKKTLWVGTENGLNMKLAESDSFTFFNTNESDGSTISSNQIYCLFEGADNSIWIGTATGLNRYNAASRTFTSFTPKEGLSGYEIYGISGDQTGNLWLSTDNGITQFNPTTFEPRRFYASDGLQGNQFNPGAVYKSASGHIFFGGSNGTSFFNPDNIKINTVKPDAIVTGVSINNNLQHPTDSNSILKESILYNQHLVLKHHQNSITFLFVSNNFLIPNKNQFKYRLLNYNDEWVDNGIQRSATFTKIPPGNYLFQVMAANNDGIWSDNATEITIHIKHPWWQRWYAYTFYMVAVLGLTFVIQREVLIRQKLKHEVLLEKVKSNSEKELNQSKLQFFTNISHEIKTPLSLILYPLESFIENRKRDIELTEYLSTIKRNGKRLINILQQAIDIRRLEAGKLTLKTDVSDINQLIQEVMCCFLLEAKEKNIDLIFNTSNPQIAAVFDKEKVDKIVFNLLNNAFKFTPTNGTVLIELNIGTKPKNYLIGDEIPSEYIEISVFNSGSFIEKEEHQLIFDRFYQSRGNKREGTGIGLHMVKEYIQLHKGQLQIESGNEDGTNFIVRIPYLKADENPVKQIDEIMLPDENSAGGTNYIDEFHSNNKTRLILIIEDNTELRISLKKSLSKHYAIITASNGEEGLKSANELNPDLILCDVMMPVMNGFEVCQRIKSNVDTSHIPVIMLTALSGTENQIEGYKTGADAYITKPFSEKLLVTQIESLLSTRQKLKEMLLSSDQIFKEAMNVIPDFSIIEKASLIIEDNLLVPDFSVDHLAAKMKMSRSSLHRKIRAHTDQSTTEFIRFIRLKKAVKMLKSGNNNIEEISYMVGFNSPSYFSHCFKKQFGISPKHYGNNE